MTLETKKITGKIKQSQFNEYEVINKGMEKAYGKPMYDLSGATIDLGSIVEQFLNAVEREEMKLKKGEQALSELISEHGTQFPMKLNGQDVVIRINGAVSKSPLPLSNSLSSRARGCLALSLVSPPVSSRKKIEPRHKLSERSTF